VSRFGRGNRDETDAPGGARASRGEPSPRESAARRAAEVRVMRIAAARRPRALVVAAGLVAAAVVLAVVALLEHGSSAPARVSPREPAAQLPATPKGAFEIGAPVPLARHRGETTWAAVRADAVARAAPSRAARKVATLRALTPEATTNIVLPLARRRLWVKVRLPALPNGRTGWVPRSALGAYGTVRTRVIVDRAARRLTLRKDGRTVLRVPVGIGTRDAPTPRGTFVIRNRLTRYKSAFYGPVALGTSARSETLTDWPGGGYVGIHGTDRPDLIPGAVSHGCIRLRNADIVRLARELPIGTPLTIQ
jgi:lipoprotein-anchoring transpeptidase ErfK/SrfK